MPIDLLYTDQKRYIRMFTAVIGEKVARSFFPFRLISHPSECLVLSHTYELPLSHRRFGYGAKNSGTQEINYDGIDIAPGHLVLVAYPYETIAARVYLPSAGAYCIVAEFLPVAGEIDFAVEVCCGGQSVWLERLRSSESSSAMVAYRRTSALTFVDFVVNARTEGRTGRCQAAVRFAIFSCDDETLDIVSRVDDEISGFGTAEAVDRARAAPRSAIRVCPEGDAVSLQQRIDCFEANWTLDRRYIPGQFQRTPLEICRSVIRERTAPRIRYAILMTPRSGSTLLSEMLASSHMMGYPVEYFVPDLERTLCLTFSDLFPSYDELITRGFQTENGVFGLEIEGERFSNESRFLSNLEDWRIVYLTRRDLLAQAISYALAIEGGLWHRFATGDRANDTLVRRSLIIEQVNFLIRMENGFETLFAEKEIQPYRLTYEDLISNPTLQARRIADHVGVEHLDFSNFDIAKATIRPTVQDINRFYELLMIMNGGEFWGYDIHRHGGVEVAVLSGIDVGQLAPLGERPPVYFVGKEGDDLRARVQAYIQSRITGYAELCAERPILMAETAKLLAESARFRTVVAEKEEELRLLMAETAKLLAESARFRTVVAEKEEELRRVLNSSSWLMTAPYREATRAVRETGRALRRAIFGVRAATRSDKH